MKLLLADDEEELSRALCAILKHAGYTVDAVDNGKDALEYARVGAYDGMILDIMMPQMDGMTVLQKLRAEGVTSPALFLTAKSEIDDRIRGLDLGADDYLIKPFDMGELLARVRAMLRRRQNFAPGELSCGSVSLDRASCELRREGHEPVWLSAREFQMMEMLMESPGRIISVDTFMDRIWADGSADSDIVWVYISNLRKKLRSIDADIEIRSTRGIGYSVQTINPIPD